MPRSPIERFTLFLVSVPLVSLGIQAQQQAAAQFEVASIRLALDCVNGAREQQSPGRFSVICVSLRDVIRVAYGGVEMQAGTETVAPTACGDTIRR